MTAGADEKEFSITMPKDDIANITKASQEKETLQDSQVAKGETKEVEIKVKVNSIQKVELPEVNDQFAKGLGKFEDLVGLENNIKRWA